MKKTKLVRVAIFYAIAITLSNIFRFDPFHVQSFFESLPVWTMVIFGPLQAIGVLAGALLAIKWLAKEGKTGISTFGSSKKWSIVMGILPVLILLMIGVENKSGVNPNYYGFISGISTLVYCFFEEIGWRGYLEEEFKAFPEMARILLISCLWYVWHLKFLGNTDLLLNLQFFGWLLLGSWGLGKIVHLTRSIVAAACFHFAINILMFNGFIRDGLSTAHKIVILGLLLMFWIPILTIWGKENAEAK